MGQRARRHYVSVPNDGDESGWPRHLATHELGNPHGPVQPDAGVECGGLLHLKRGRLHEQERGECEAVQDADTIGSEGENRVHPRKTTSEEQSGW